jgi:hypothetical protein
MVRVDLRGFVQKPLLEACLRRIAEARVLRRVLRLDRRDLGVELSRSALALMQNARSVANEPSGRVLDLFTLIRGGSRSLRPSPARENCGATRAGLPRAEHRRVRLHVSWGAARASKEKEEVMRRVLMSVTIAAIAATSIDVLADEPVGTTTTMPAPAPPPPATPTQATPTTQETAAPATTLTSAVVPEPPPLPNERDTVTLTQKFRPHRPLIVTGSVLLVGAYVPTAVLTATNNQDRSLYIPVVGPWLHLADRKPGEDAGIAALIAASGIVQGAGVIIMGASMFIPEKVPVATIQAGNVKINLSPTSYGRGTAALGAVGTF